MLLALVSALLLAQVQPAAGAQARVLSCGPSPTVRLSLYTWEEESGRVRLRHQKGTAAGELKASLPKRGKPPPGCPFGLPLPSADWKLAAGETWTRDEVGNWTDSKGKKLTLQCEERTLKAVENASVLASNPASDGCGGERQLVLTGGPRVEVPVVRCRLRSDRETVTLTFGAELVWSDNDCGGGSDWRVVR